MAELTCFCFRVEKSRVIEAIGQGCHSVDAIRDALGATAGCGGCIPDVEALIDFYAPANPAPPTTPRLFPASG